MISRWDGKSSFLIKGKYTLPKDPPLIQEDMFK